VDERERSIMKRWGLAVVDGRSMLPTLRPGDRLLVEHGGTPSPNRIAVVRLPDRPLSVKRLGVRDADGWWVERDNPREGVDSWSLGRPVADDDVVAIVVARVWPRPSRLRRR
jgi:signal peptidase I